MAINKFMRNFINILAESQSLEQLADEWSGNTYSDDEVMGGPASKYIWKEVPDWNINRKIDGLTPKRRTAWMRDEIQMWADEGDPERYDGMLGHDILEPVVAVEVDGEAYLWDGNHRVGAALMNGKTTVPAIVGTPKI
jgi:hypothetical protein